MKFYCELKKVVDDSYDIEIGHKLSDTLINDIQNGLVGKIKNLLLLLTLSLRIFMQRKSLISLLQTVLKQIYSLFPRVKNQKLAQ